MFQTLTRIAQIGQLIAVLSVITPLNLSANSLLIGNWVAPQSEDSLALPGELTLTESGEARLAPAGFEPLSGTWSATDSSLTFSMPPHGTVTMEYLVEDNNLTLTHLNGAVEHLTKTIETTPLRLPTESSYEN